MTHIHIYPYVWHDSHSYISIRVTWLTFIYIHTCDMTTYMLHMNESFAQVICMNKSFACVSPLHYSCIYVTGLIRICVLWLIHTCDMSHSYVWRVLFSSVHTSKEPYILSKEPLLMEYRALLIEHRALLTMCGVSCSHLSTRQKSPIFCQKSLFWWNIGLFW